MNMYNLNRIMAMCSVHGIKDVFLEVVDAGGFISAFVFAKKPLHPATRPGGEHLWAAKLDS